MGERLLLVVGKGELLLLQLLLSLNLQLLQHLLLLRHGLERIRGPETTRNDRNNEHTPVFENVLLVGFLVVLTDGLLSLRHRLRKS